MVNVRWEKIDGQMRMVEQPGSEKILEADMILLALGFLGAELLSGRVKRYGW